MRELGDRLLRAGILFVLIWVVLYVMNIMACRQIKGSEMAPVIEAGGYKFMAPVSGKEGMATGQVVHFHQEPPTGVQQETFVGRIEALEGSTQDMPSLISILNGHDKNDRIKLLVPRGCVIVLAENQKMDKVDSRFFGPIRLWAIDARSR